MIHSNKIEQAVQEVLNARDFGFLEELETSFQPTENVSNFCQIAFPSENPPTALFREAQELQFLDEMLSIGVLSSEKGHENFLVRNKGKIWLITAKNEEQAVLFLQTAPIG